MEWLSVHDWPEWQTYRKDRGAPPWIKVHRTLLRDVKWASLGCHDRGVLVSLWLLAADHDGKIPADPLMVQKFCLLEEPPDLEKFIDSGWLDRPRRQRGVNVASTRRQPDRTETETEADTDTDTEKETKAPKEPGANHRFVPPTPDQVTEYARSIGFELDGATFVDHYEASGWFRGKTKIKSWQACVRTWRDNGRRKEERSGPLSAKDWARLAAQTEEREREEQGL